MELVNLPPLDAYGSEDVEFVFPLKHPFCKKVEDSIGFPTLQAYPFFVDICKPFMMAKGKASEHQRSQKFCQQKIDRILQEDQELQKIEERLDHLSGYLLLPQRFAEEAEEV